MSVVVNFSRADFSHLSRFPEDEIIEAKDMLKYYAEKDGEEDSAARAQNKIDQLTKWLDKMNEEEDD